MSALADTLQSLWASGWLLTAVIAFTLLEAAALLVYRQVSGKGIALRDWGLNLLSGLCLMMAVRSAVLNAAWPAIAAWLSAAGLAHGADMVSRWRRQRRTFG